VAAAARRPPIGLEQMFESIIRFSVARSPSDAPERSTFESGFCGLPVCSRKEPRAAPQSLSSLLSEIRRRPCESHRRAPTSYQHEDVTEENSWALLNGQMARRCLSGARTRRWASPESARSLRFQLPTLHRCGTDTEQTNFEAGCPPPPQV